MGSTNSQDENDALIEVPCLNEGSGWDSIESQGLVEELLLYIPIFLGNHDLDNQLSL